MTDTRIVRNEDVAEIRVEIPPGHRHLRTSVRLTDGTEWVFQEATLANLVRAYVDVKTHPLRRAMKLVGRIVPEPKQGYAAWQLLEEDPGRPD
jgi:hypothetical protein